MLCSAGIADVNMGGHGSCRNGIMTKRSVRDNKDLSRFELDTGASIAFVMGRRYRPTRLVSSFLWRKQYTWVLFH